MRVLIVEDEALLAMSYRMALDGGECNVVGVAKSADEALRLTGKHQPDVVLMDIRLRGKLDGIEAAKTIMNTHGTAVIFVTGNTDEETRTRALSIKPKAYLEKPIDCEKLHQALCVDKIMDI